ncbi:MAG: hypothetical protein JWR01_1464, partial [Subtercola sp.]|nr:hypothetical protein [Subtercola sp.]
MTQTIDEYSVFFLYAAMAVYAMAFIAFALDLARRSAQVGAGNTVGVDGSVTTGELVLEKVGAGAVSGTSASLNESAALPARTGLFSRGGGAASDDSSAGAGAARRSLSLRLGVAFTLIGFLLELTADVLRGIAAARVPWANMYEFSMTGTVLIVCVFLIVINRVDLRFLGTFITVLVLILLGFSTVNYYVG